MCYSRQDSQNDFKKQKDVLFLLLLPLSLLPPTPGPPLTHTHDVHTAD